MARSKKIRQSKRRRVLEDATGRAKDPAIAPQVREEGGAALRTVNLWTLQEVLMGPLLKHLYELSIKLSCKFSQHDGYGGAIPMCVPKQWLVGKVNCSDVIDLSILLFEELHKQFERLISGMSYVPCVVVSDVNGCQSSDAKISPEDFLLLLRCSIIIMQFLEFNLSLVLERCQILVAILRKLCPPVSPLQFLNRHTRHVDLATPEAGISTNFAFAILEVFLDELLRNHELRKHFITADCTFATKGKLFLSHGQNDFQVIMELVSSHFLLSFYDESAFDSFIHSLSWSTEVENQIPVLGLDSALTLLSYPVIFSAPHLLQAHLILLVSRCLGIHMPADAKKLDALAMNLFILAFELSVKLYSGYMPCLNNFGRVTGDLSKSSSGARVLSFYSCIQSLTGDKLRQQIDILIDFCHLPSHGLHAGSKVEILENSIAYIKGNKKVINERFRDEVCSILTCIVESTLPGESELLHEGGKSIQQEVYCVAATLNLMSSSLLQILWFLKQNGYSAGLKTSKQILVCKEYDFISGIISCFGNCQVEPHIQKLLFGVMENTNGGHRETKLMFSHLVSILSYSFRENFDFLWKGCISVMISLMNLFIFEEGNLDAFRPFLRDIRGTTSHASQAKILKDSVHKSSITIASNLKKVRDQIEYQRYEGHRSGMGETTEKATPDGNGNGNPNVSDTFQSCGTEKHDTAAEAKTCTGEIFLKCLPGFRKNHSDWDDLADFIECKRGKDYSAWLEKRARFRKWKYRRMSSIKHEVRRSRRRETPGSLVRVSEQKM